MESKLIYETNSDQLYMNSTWIVWNAISFLGIVSKLIKKDPISSEPGIETYAHNSCILKVYYSGKKNQIMASGQEDKIKELEGGLVKCLKSAELFTD